MKHNFRGIGMMSGSSLDGLDLACVEFIRGRNQWKYKIICAETRRYPPVWKEKLSTLGKKPAAVFAHAHVEYGHFLGEEANKFIRRHHLHPQFIASHGHTVFHQPHKGFTFQIGDGAALMAETGLPVVADFRSADVARGGQGAPLVPFGEQKLFVRNSNEAQGFLNLGGIANISFHYKNRVAAFDVCPCNLILNELALLAGKQEGFDRDGRLARKGNIHLPLLRELNRLAYYKKSHPKSLGREWFEQKFRPVFVRYRAPVRDKLSTAVEHISQQITRACNALLPPHHNKAVLLITGGGAKNRFLFHSLEKKISPLNIQVSKNTSSVTVDYKEALIFAFLGLCRLRGEINTLASVTGAEKDSSGGAVYIPPRHTHNFFA